MKKILLTGTGPHGFVGRNLAEQLHEKYELFTPPRSELDIRDYEATARYVFEHRVEVVVHACSAGEIDADLRMFFSLERISSSLEKIIYFGSGAEFDKRFDITYANETDIGRHIPESGYGFAKYIMNAQARHSDNIYNLRLFGIFGKYEDWRVKFISNLCCKAIFELPLTIRKECRFDYAFVDDLADIVLYFIENKPLYHDYNFAYGKPVLLTQIANMISLVSGKKQDIMLLDKVGFNKDYTANNERLKIETGFTPTPIEDAIEKLYQYYYDNRDIIDAKTLKSTR